MRVHPETKIMVVYNAKGPSANWRWKENARRLEADGFGGSFLTVHRLFAGPAPSDEGRIAAVEAALSGRGPCHVIVATCKDRSVGLALASHFYEHVAQVLVTDAEHTPYATYESFLHQRRRG